MKIEEFIAATVDQFRTSHGNEATRMAQEIIKERCPIAAGDSADLGEYIAMSLRNAGVDLPGDVSI